VIQLIAESEIGGEAPGEIGADGGTGGSGEINGTIADEIGRVRIARLRIAGLKIMIGGLRESPDVVFGEETVRRAVSAATIGIGRGGSTVTLVVPFLCVVDLVVESFRFVIPHFQKPVDAELGFAGEV
jgi:hypothetical protein